MTVNGRHGYNARPKFTSEESVGPGGVTLRIDDESNLSFWLEVHITKEELENILARVKNDSTNG